jgi:hypothetical protein
MGHETAKSEPRRRVRVVFEFEPEFSQVVESLENGLEGTTFSELIRRALGLTALFVDEWQADALFVVRRGFQREQLNFLEAVESRVVQSKFRARLGADITERDDLRLQKIQSQFDLPSRAIAARQVIAFTDRVLRYRSGGWDIYRIKNGTEALVLLAF